MRKGGGETDWFPFWKWLGHLLGVRKSHYELSLHRHCVSSGPLGHNGLGYHLIHLKCFPLTQKTEEASGVLDNCHFPKRMQVIKLERRGHSLVRNKDAYRYDIKTKTKNHYKCYQEMNLWVRVLLRYCSNEVCVGLERPGLN